MAQAPHFGCGAGAIKYRVVFCCSAAVDSCIPFDNDTCRARCRKCVVCAPCVHHHSATAQFLHMAPLPNDDDSGCQLCARPKAGCCAPMLVPCSEQRW